ncbi:hypothetical protein FQA39_LY09720 [Lamprigera yunnana]|nr:hypothetical protein FQA39_LY09720 [Lamprigera yunnana]
MATRVLSKNNSDYHLNDVIRLQLKKPKNWNWELSTSKSSPNIILPTVKLYNSKGKLLVEAKDKSVQRRSWHSSDTKPISEIKNINNKTEKSNFNSKILTKSKSDIFHKKKYERKKEDSVLLDNLNPLRKSNSEMLQQLKSNNILRTIRSVRGSSFCRAKYENPDDLFYGLMKYNEESVKRSIEDGYRNFITPMVPKDVNQNGVASKKQKHAKEICDRQNISNTITPDINYFTHKRYKTRTCSAGTLIICEDSFNTTCRRRRGNVNGNANKIEISCYEQDCSSDDENLNTNNILIEINAQSDIKSNVSSINRQQRNMNKRYSTSEKFLQGNDPIEVIYSESSAHSQKSLPVPQNSQLARDKNVSRCNKAVHN